MITTNVSDKGNFIVHTTDPRKGWSKPKWVRQGGIDPSLFWDDDGKVYLVSTGHDMDGQCTIDMCEINPFTGEQLSESKILSYGCGGKYPEGAHLYKCFGKYYLMMAEGGTEYGHMETIQRSDSPYGPYESCPHNPILTHRDDTKGEIHCTGHADLVEDQNGNWWIVCLGTRCNGGKSGIMMQHHLGRETFLAPVTWTDDGWPIVGNDGKIALSMEGPLPSETVYEKEQNFTDDFSQAMFDLRYNYLRNPEMECYVRDTDRVRIPNGEGVQLKIVADKEKYRFYYCVDGEQNILLGSGLTAGLSTEGTVPMSFTGTYIGMFAENGSSAFQEFQVNYVLPDE